MNSGVLKQYDALVNFVALLEALIIRHVQRTGNQTKIPTDRYGVFPVKVESEYQMM